MVELYGRKGLNPDYAELIGTLAPWHEGEMMSVPVGRALMPTGKFACLPAGSNPNGRAFPFAPAMAHLDSGRGILSVDFSGTFPDHYKSTAFDPLRTGDNPKYDFGPVHLVAVKDGREHDLGAVPYQDTAQGDCRGWVFDFPVGGLSTSDLDVIETGGLSLRHATAGDLLTEADYFIASDQACLFGEQGKAGDTSQLFRSQSAPRRMPPSASSARGRKSRPPTRAARRSRSGNTTPPPTRRPEGACSSRQRSSRATRSWSGSSGRGTGSTPSRSPMRQARPLPTGTSTWSRRR